MSWKQSRFILLSRKKQSLMSADINAQVQVASLVG